MTIEYVYNAKHRPPFEVIIITDLYSAFRSEDTEALEAAQESWNVVNKLLWSKYVDNNKRQCSSYQLTGTLKRIEQNLFIRIGKSEAEVTNNNRLHWKCCTVEPN